METNQKIITNIDQHGRMLIPANIRERLNLFPGDKVNLEIHEDGVKIINANKIIDEMHNIFVKNQNIIKNSIVDDFINSKRKEYIIEQARAK